jgi:hypothetical protein
MHGDIALEIEPRAFHVQGKCTAQMFESCSAAVVLGSSTVVVLLLCAFALPSHPYVSFTGISYLKDLEKMKQLKKVFSDVFRG